MLEPEPEPEHTTSVSPSVRKHTEYGDVRIKNAALKRTLNEERQRSRELGISLERLKAEVGKHRMLQHHGDGDSEAEVLELRAQLEVAHARIRDADGNSEGLFSSAQQDSRGAATEELCAAEKKNGELEADHAHMRVNFSQLQLAHAQLQQSQQVMALENCRLKQTVEALQAEVSDLHAQSEVIAQATDESQQQQQQQQQQHPTRRWRRWDPKPPL